MNLRTRITDLLGSKKLRSSTLAAIAALSWITWSALPGMAVSDNAESPAGILFSSVDGAYAEGDAAPAGGAAATGGATASKTATPGATPNNSTAGATAVNGLIEAVMMLFLPATFIAGWLLSPDWTFGEIFGLRPIIHSLWVLISNVVYVIFAFLLVAMAFMNIFWQWGDHYAMKKALPRFVTGILIVPFTWFIVSGVLSISNLLTASVLRLPADILDKTIVSWDAAKSKNEPTFSMPDKCTLSFDKAKQAVASATAKATGGSSEKPSDTTAKFFSCSEAKHEVKFREALNGKGTYGILNLYAYDVFKVDQIKKIDGVNLKSVWGVADIVLTVGLWGVFLIVYALLMLALCFALITRAFYLWIIAIFSPLFGLFYYMEGKGKIAESMKNLSFTSFISLALVPVYVSAALGFWLLFLKMAENAEIAPESSSFFAVGSKTEDASSGNATFEMGSENNKTVIEVKGFPVGQAVKKAAAWAKTNGEWLVKLAASSIGKIIVQILGIVVLWMAVMVALKSNEITAEAVKPISDFGSSMGKLAMDMPKYVPIPLGKGEDGKERKLSMAWLGSMGQGISSAISSSAISQGSEMGQKFGAWVAEALGMASNKNVLALQRINEQMKNTTDPTQVARLTKEALANTWATSSEDLMKKPIEREKLIAALSSARPEVFTDHKAAKHALEEMKKATTSSTFRDEFDKFNAQIKGQKIGSHESVNEFDEVLKQNSSNQAGSHSQAQSPSVTPQAAPNSTPAAPAAPPAPPAQPNNAATGGGGSPGPNGQT